MTYVPDLIRVKRDGGELTEDQIRELVTGIADGSVSDAQVGALAMAIVLNGMTSAERIALTGAMRDSGDVLDWSDAGLPGPALDKHSTGGVGDKVSLLLAPIVAACGGAVPMISGRGLGHTGGTLDKLESIPGYDTTPEPDAFRAAVANAGAAIVGQTARLAPADRRLYAIRDATGTVESIPLIVASILSKKLAAGLDALVMDVKVGSGAFLPDRESAEELARAIVEVAGGNGLPTAALLTDMDRVLGRTAGNAVEVRESIDHLTGAASDERLREVTLALSAELLALGGVEPDAERARAAAERALDSGAAAERFAAMVTELGGPADLLEAPDRHLPTGAGDGRGRAGGGGDGERRGRARGGPGRGGTRWRPHPRGRPGGPRRRPHRRGGPRRGSGSRRATAGDGAREGRGKRPPRDGSATRGLRARRSSGGPGSGPGSDQVIPKAELHVHLEGTAPPDLIRRIAERNGLELPDGLFAAPDRFAYRDFLDFLDTYDKAASVIRTVEDYRDITYEYLVKCAGEGAVYVELTASPDHARLVGLTDEEHVDGIARGIDDAREEAGIEGRILISCVRNFGVESALRIARYAAERPHPYIVGFSMAGDEQNYPPGDVRGGVRDRRRRRSRLHGPRRRVGRPRERASGP